ncbi:unnamed protein product [Owenia fusiformis]|uniref:Uncharacterized protein n=1 Tax=Owenia fusiformis TaxID=6347 RepID=A0A8J1U0C9_OWEFU|nr:unnamed protein product [Owenia fusiformis]
MSYSKPIGVMSDPTDVRQVFFTNLLLLGFDPDAAEAKYKLLFNRDMFALPNKTGFEVVLHFLFNRLNPTLSRETFRDCWPVRDKKQEQLFRRGCNNWLTNIAKDEVDAHLPRITPSVFMSPGGDRFYQLMFAFSTYVLRVVLHIENGVKDRDHLLHPKLTHQTSGHADVMTSTIQCGTIQRRKEFIHRVQDITSIQEQWKAYAGELVKSYRALSKAIREKERLVRTEIQRAVDRGTGSPRRRKSSGLYDYDFDTQAVKRAQKVQKVRDLWKLLDDFYTSNTPERDVVSSILQRSLDQHRLDAGDIHVKVPDILLRECQEELQRRGVSNVYENGKLNLISLINLWNLSLHLYIEKLHKVGLRSFEECAGKVAGLVHTHHAHLTNARTLRNELSSQLVPELKTSIEQLRKSLKTNTSSRTPHQTKSASVRLGLVPTTPPISFSTDNIATPQGNSTQSLLKRNTQDKVMTPEAVSQLADTISRASKLRHSSLVQGSPVYAPKMGTKVYSNASDGTKLSKDSQIPKPVYQFVDVERVGNKQRTRIQSAPSGARTQKEAIPVLTPNKDVSKARENLTSQTVRANRKPTNKKDVRKLGTEAKVPLVVRNSDYQTPVKTPPAHQKLVDRIADAMMSETPDVAQQMRSNDSSPALSPYDINLQSPMQALDEGAFQTKNKLSRTPEGATTWHQTLLQDQSHDKLDSVSKTLFSDEDVEAGIVTLEVTQKDVQPGATFPLSPKQTSISGHPQSQSREPCLLDADTIYNSPQRRQNKQPLESDLRETLPITSISAHPENESKEGALRDLNTDLRHSGAGLRHTANVLEHRNNNSPPKDSGYLYGKTGIPVGFKDENTNNNTVSNSQHGPEPHDDDSFEMIKNFAESLDRSITEYREELRKSLQSSPEKAVNSAANVHHLQPGTSRSPDEKFSLDFSILNGGSPATDLNILGSHLESEHTENINVNESLQKTYGDLFLNGTTPKSLGTSSTMSGLSPQLGNGVTPQLPFRRTANTSNNNISSERPITLGHEAYSPVTLNNSALNNSDLLTSVEMPQGFLDDCDTISPEQNRNTDFLNLSPKDRNDLNQNQFSHLSTFTEVSPHVSRSLSVTSHTPTTSPLSRDDTFGQTGTVKNFIREQWRSPKPSPNSKTNPAFRTEKLDSITSAAMKESVSSNDVIARYKRLREKTNQINNSIETEHVVDEGNTGEATRLAERLNNLKVSQEQKNGLGSPLNDSIHIQFESPQQSNGLDEKYLLKSPRRETQQLEKRFSLNLDDYEVSPPLVKSSNNSPRDTFNETPKTSFPSYNLDDIHFSPLGMDTSLLGGSPIVQQSQLVKQSPIVQPSPRAKFTPRKVNERGVNYVASPRLGASPRIAISPRVEQLRSEISPRSAMNQQYSPSNTQPSRVNRPTQPDWQKFDDILGEDDSILLPSSPGATIGQLVDI